MTPTTHYSPAPWADLQIDVAQWSTTNFGFQQSKQDPDMFLDSLAPLMGMAEEIGEWMEAETKPDQRDALGDLLVYLLDYTSREGLLLQRVPERILEADPMVEILGSLGKLFHATLKRHQGIRGMDDRGRYCLVRDTAILKIINAVDALCLEEFKEPAYSVAKDTWDKVVAKRDWKRNPEDGAEALTRMDGEDMMSPPTDANPTPDWSADEDQGPDPDPHAFVDGPQ